MAATCHGARLAKGSFMCKRQPPATGASVSFLPSCGRCDGRIDWIRDRGAEYGRTPSASARPAIRPAPGPHFRAANGSTQRLAGTGL